MYKGFFTEVEVNGSGYYKEAWSCEVNIHHFYWQWGEFTAHNE